MRLEAAAGSPARPRERGDNGFDSEALTSLTMKKKEEASKLIESMRRADMACYKMI